MSWHSCLSSPYKTVEQLSAVDRSLPPKYTTPARKTDRHEDKCGPYEMTVKGVICKNLPPLESLQAFAVAIYHCSYQLPLVSQLLAQLAGQLVALATKAFLRYYICNNGTDRQTEDPKRQRPSPLEIHNDIRRQEVPGQAGQHLCYTIFRRLTKHQNSYFSKYH